MLPLMLLHPVERLDWIRWSIHPSTVIGIAALAALYAWRVSRGPPDSAGDSRGMNGTARTPSTPQRLAFAGGLATLFASLNGPIHDLSDYYLFSAHMVQHLLLTMLVTPLLIAATPGWMLRPFLRSPAMAGLARRITSPRACFVIFNVTLAAWHLPPLYNLAMASHPVHIVQHLSFLVASTLMWWPLMSRLPELPRPSYPRQMLYTVLMTLPMTMVAVFITYADSSLYPAYESAPRVWGLSPLEDQLLGGLIMWIPGGLIFVGVMTVIFFRWVAQEEGRVSDAPLELDTSSLRAAAQRPRELSLERRMQSPQVSAHE